MFPIQLSVNPIGWRLFMQRKLNQRFDGFRQKVFIRDNFTCQFCGLESEKHLEVINLDQDYYNNEFSNCVTACGLCVQCFFLQSVHYYGGGTLIYCPEISQNDLNSFCHVLLTAIAKETEYKEAAQEAYRSLKSRSQVIESEWGAQMQEPSVFGQLLVETESQALLAKEGHPFKAVRLLPSRTGFKQQREEWSRSVLSLF